MNSKFKVQRPGSSARVYEDDNSECGVTEKKTKIPKMPKRTYSLEDKGCCSSSRKRSSSQLPSSTTSMIPRPDWKKTYRKPFTQDNRVHKPTPQPELTPQDIDRLNAAVENKINEDFQNFKQNVKKIPEYWSDAGQTVTKILQNALNIVTRQYPAADVEPFEIDLQNILKATEAIKQEILMKTENIIEKANKIYSEQTTESIEPEDVELMKITRTMEELRNEVHIRKNVFGDLLKCSTEMKQLMELEKSLRNETPKRSNKKPKKEEKKYIQSCGDVPKQEARTAVRTETKPFLTHLEDKASQTVNLYTAELNRRQNLFNSLNAQIVELQQLCKDHISKFKSFNLQIKLRGVCNKAQTNTSKEIQILKEEKTQLTEKNSKLNFSQKDLESAIKQKEQDIRQKDKLICQQKKLLQVRDELIEMLKKRCNITEEDER